MPAGSFRGVSAVVEAVAAAVRGVPATAHVCGGVSPETLRKAQELYV